MAFTPNTLGVIVQPIGGDGMRFISYRTDDDQATVTASDYFAGASQYGIRVSDLLFVSPLSVSFDPYILNVTMVDAEGNVSASINDDEMLKSVYDPQGIADDAFDRANHTGTQSADTITDGVTNKAYTATEQIKLSGIEAGADVTDAANVAAAGAVMESDASTASMSFVIDEDDMASDSATKVPTQQSVVAYTGGVLDSGDAGKTLVVKSDGSGFDVGVTPQESGPRLEVINDFTASDARKTLALDASGALVGLTRPFYNPYDYEGFVGNGSADDTNQIMQMLADAKANAGIQTNPKGRGTMIIPPAFATHDGSLVLDVAGLKLVGLGGQLRVNNANVPVLKVTASGTVLEDLTLYNPLMPTTDVGCFEHAGGADCNYSNVECIGGWYNFKGTSGGDSAFWKLKTRRAYGDNVFLQGFSGFWSYRGKHDEQWPVQDPVSANYKGAYAPGALVAGDVIEDGNWTFQIRVGGTATATAGTIQATIFGTDVDLGGGVMARMAMRKDRAGMRIRSDVFNVMCHNGDFTNGHYHGVVTENVGGTSAPQTLMFAGGGEFGQNLIRNFWGKDATNLTIDGMTIDEAVISTGLGVDLANVLIARITANMIRGLHTGVQLQSGVNDVTVHNNSFGGCDTAVKALANAKHFKILDNNLGGISSLWGVNDVPYDLGTGTDYCWVRDNTIDGATSAAIDSNPTRSNGSIGDNL